MLQKQIYDGMIGKAMNSIYALTEKAKKNKISMESYISLFKEYV